MCAVPESCVCSGGAHDNGSLPEEELKQMDAELRGNEASMVAEVKQCHRVLSDIQRTRCGPLVFFADGSQRRCMPYVWPFSFC